MFIIPMHRSSGRIVVLFLFCVCLLWIMIAMQSSLGQDKAIAENPQSYIVTSKSSEAAAEAVMVVGGHVTDQLNIINSVGADLTTFQVKQLQDQYALNVFPNQTVINVANEDISTYTVRDAFEATSYNNQDGSENWLSSWEEIDSITDPNNGRIRIRTSSNSGTQCETNTCLRIGQDWGTETAIQRKANLFEVTEATLTFDWRRDSNLGFYTSTPLDVQISSDNQNWATVHTIYGGTDPRQNHETIDITPYTSAETTLRIQLPSSMSGYVFIDNIEIAYARSNRDGNTTYGKLIDLYHVHDQNLTGEGIGIAVLDSGFFKHPALTNKYQYQWRVVQYNAFTNEVRTDPTTPESDQNGHGAHISSILFNNETNTDGEYNGIAPNANFITVTAFDSEGKGAYTNVIKAIDWVVSNRQWLNIRVLNLSFSAKPQSFYWDDPLNQAVMRAWQAGIVVVAAASNNGPDPMTIGVPGNVPYIITVGAVSDNYTPDDKTDDFLTSFSATGPTYEGFVKPDVVAPGGHVLGLMSEYATIATKHPEFHNQGRYFMMSGTSQATAVTSGVVALMIQANPSLTPDDVKCQLMASARPAVNADGTALAYSIFQQGAGLINATDAIANNKTGCVNIGMDINKDIAGTEHYYGRAMRDEDGNYYISGLDGFLWNGGFLWNEGFLWSDGFLWNGGFLWNEGFLWNDSFLWNDGFLWSESSLWSEGFLWSSSTDAELNKLVPQE